MGGGSSRCQPQKHKPKQRRQPSTSQPQRPQQTQHQPPQQQQQRRGATNEHQIAAVVGVSSSAFEVHARSANLSSTAAFPYCLRLTDDKALIGWWAGGSVASWTLPTDIAVQQGGAYTVAIFYTKASNSAMDGKLRFSVDDKHIDLPDPQPTTSSNDWNVANREPLPMVVPGRFDVKPGSIITLAALSGAPHTGIWGVARIRFDASSSATTTTSSSAAASASASADGNRIPTRNEIVQAIDEGKITVEEELGRSNFVVHRVSLDDFAGHPGIACKVFPIGRDGEDEMAAAQAEFDRSCGVQHGNVVDVYRLLWDGTEGVARLFMELLSPLPQRLPEEAAIDVVCHVLAGLAAIHNKGLIHGDLKPDNIMQRQDKYVIVDFGVCCATRRITTLMQVRASTTLQSCDSVTARGFTPMFAAPEVLDRDHHITTAFDIYSIGVTYLALVHGRETVLRQFYNHRTAVVTPPGADASRWLRATLAPSPQQRPSATQLLAMLS